MKIQLIIGSTRPGRVGPQIADWIIDSLPKKSGIEYEIVDVKKWDLPIFNEPIHPSMGQYQHEHTKAWSNKIKEADAYIFLTPEYNAGYPAALKNAIDYLYHEWQNKPLIIISYGVGGGPTASAQLRQVAERLKMRPTKISPALVVTREMSDKNGRIRDIAGDFKPYLADLHEASEQLLHAINHQPISE